MTDDPKTPEDFIALAEAQGAGGDDETPEDLTPDDLAPDDLTPEVAPPEVAEPDPETLKIEEEARKWGWKPESEWRGDKKGWTPADRFLELPGTKIKQLEARLEERERDYQDRLTRVERANKAAMEQTIAAQKQAHERQLSQLRAAQRRAVEDGDMEAYDKFEKAEQEMLRRAPQAPLEPQGPPQELIDYAATEEGSWVADPVLFKEAGDLVDASPVALSMKPADQFAWARRQLAAKYPELFPAKAEPEPPKPQQQRARVDGGGLAGGGQKSLSAKLPAEVRKVAQDLVESGYVKSVDEYAKAYFEDNK